MKLAPHPARDRAPLLNKVGNSGVAQADEEFARPYAGPALADLVALTKPRITLMVLMTAGGGMWLASAGPSPFVVLGAMFSIVLVVSAANALNCYIERDVDRYMARTRTRPLPAGRVDPAFALRFATVLAVLSAASLLLLVNTTTAALGITSLLMYAGLYTPMKQRSPLALFVGAVPGAMPPLMGWTAATGTIGWAGLALFGVLYLWQLPHFLAIATFRSTEYVAAGHKVLPAVYGRTASYIHALVWGTLLVPVSLAFEPLGLVSSVYTWLTGLLSVGYLLVTAIELRPSRGDAGARRVFFTSLVYIPLWLVVLALTYR